MNFNIKYPEAIKPKRPGYHEEYKSPEVEVETGVFFSDRYYACGVCGTRTSFIEYLGDCVSHICSEECMEQSAINYKESESQNVNILHE